MHGERKSSFVMLCFSLCGCVFLLAGCASKMAVEVRDQATGQPIVGALVRIDRPASLVAKIVNPVGTFYHPDVFDYHWTGVNGSCVVTKPSRNDVVRLFVAGNQPVLLTFGSHTQALSVGTNQHANSWCYTFRQNGKTWDIQGSEPGFDWQKDRTSTR